jgi:hypothetical protein
MSPQGENSSMQQCQIIYLFVMGDISWLATPAFSDQNTSHCPENTSSCCKAFSVAAMATSGCISAELGLYFLN